MSKFNRPGAYTAHSPVTTTGPTTTHEGGEAWFRDEKSELVMLAVVNMASEDTFYESAKQRDDRYAALVRVIAVADPNWMIKFVTWLRNDANMRSASLIAAAEGVKARLDVRQETSFAGLSTGVNRKLVAAPLVRPDEPGEFLAYWTSRFGRKLPQPVKRGVADAVRRLYTERSLLKYDTASHAWRFGDVIDVTHPAPDPERITWQGDLFKHALDRRHGHDMRIPDSLRTVRNNLLLRAAPDSISWLNEDAVRDAGMTWEDVLSAVGGKFDKALLWKAMIPSMGYMALLRNLRNFDEAGVDDVTAARVCERLADPEQVAKSRQFPFRFLSAYRAAPSLRWGHALEKALYHACENVPVFKGRTLVLVDTSGSMGRNVSDKSAVRHVDVGALFGVALAVRGADVDLVGFANGSFRHPLMKGAAVLRQTEAFMMRLGEVGHGTETATALRNNYDRHDRVVVISDMQAFRDWSGLGGSVSEAIPANVPMFGINTTGYAQTSIDTSKPNRYEIGGFSDKLFTMVDLLARGRDASWPWEG